VGITASMISSLSKDSNEHHIVQLQSGGTQIILGCHYFPTSFWGFKIVLKTTKDPWTKGYNDVVEFCANWTGLVELILE